MPGLLNPPIIGCMLAGFAMPAMSHTTSFGEPYSQHQKVTAELSQIIFYRQNALFTANGDTTIYIDGKRHTSLLPGGYTAFCVQPGEHTLSARGASFLTASGQQNLPFTLRSQAGKTYYSFDKH